MEYRRLNEKPTERYKKVTLLHSNDMHGDFLVDKVDNKLTGGVSMLSGYLTKCRNEDPNVVYAIAGTCSAAPSSTASTWAFPPSRS